jgi:hypothetical protein
MALDDYLESEVALAGDAVASVARGAGRGAQQAAGRVRSTEAAPSAESRSR